jgi:hypothetical protein
MKRIIRFFKHIYGSGSALIEMWNSRLYKEKKKVDGMSEKMKHEIIKKTNLAYISMTIPFVMANMWLRICLATKKTDKVIIDHRKGQA